MKVSSVFKKKKIQKGEGRNRTQSDKSAVHHLYHCATEGLLTIDGLIRRYTAITLISIDSQCGSFFCRDMLCV